jgi:Fe-S-cluster containining protein
MDKEIRRAQKMAKLNMERISKEIPPLLEKKEEELYDRFIKYPTIPIIDLGTLFNFMNEINNFCSKYLPCHKGCDYCCYIPIDISTLESEYIRTKTGIVNNKNPIFVDKKDSACPFLVDHCCSIYEYRPYVCRKHNALYDNPELCGNAKYNGIEFTQFKFTEVEKSYEYLVNRSGSIICDIRGWFPDIRR